jgi:hypothetical protein
METAGKAGGPIRRGARIEAPPNRVKMNRRRDSTQETLRVFQLVGLSVGVRVTRLK